MDYIKNHCWCSRSNWDSKYYNCQIIVSISNYGDDEEDWNNIIKDDVEYFDEEGLRDFRQKLLEDKDRFPEEANVDSYLDKTNFGHKFTNKLRADVFHWLELNVKDTKQGKGWCVGDDKYNSNDTLNFCIFFQRRQDAMSFIKRWSKWRKPVNYCQYFTDVRKRLNLETLKYEDV